jgi:hypothetical protein
MTEPLITASPRALMPEEDPLLCNMQMPFRAVFYPLGFAVEIATNRREVLDAAKESWGHLQEHHSHPAIQIRIGVAGNDLLVCPPTPIVRAHQHLLSIVADAQNHIVCDLKARFAFAWINEATLRHPMYLRYHFIESAALILISTSYVTALHAACVSRHGRGILLSGDSGAGKSTLAYACARSGWTYTSDDASYLLRETNGETGRPRVIGNCSQLRFRPSARELFPELEGRGLTPRAEGKPSIEVRTSEINGIATAEEASIHYLVFLNRRLSPDVELFPISSAMAFQRLQRSFFPLDEIRQVQIASLQQLSSLPVYELRYRDLDSAIERLELLTESGAAHS